MSDTILLQAPVGGAKSRVNGQHYKGGQFMPDSGLFCGAKKAARKWAALCSENWCEIETGENFPRARAVRTENGRQVFRIFYLVNKRFSSREETISYCEEVVRLRSDSYIAAGLQPHPTEIVERFSR